MTSRMVLTYAIILIVFRIGIGCEKAKTPFSADPIQPTQGKLDVYLTDNGTPVPNLTVKAVDPTGNNFTTITDSTGMAVLNPVPFHFGNWAVQIPTQGKYYTSSMAVSMPDGIQSQTVTFHAEPPILTLNPIKNSYPYGSGPVTYSVGFQPGGNLNVQEILSIPVSNFPATTWTSQFFPPLLGDSSGNTSAELIINVPSCSYEQPVFQVMASENGVIFTSSNASMIKRDFTIKATLRLSNPSHTCTNLSPSGCTQWTDSWLVTFLAENDCGIPWNVSIIYNLFSINNWELFFPDGSNTGQINSGITYTINGVKTGYAFGLIYTYSSDKTPIGNSAVSSVIGSGSNNGTVDASWNF